MRFLVHDLVELSENIVLVVRDEEERVREERHSLSSTITLRLFSKILDAHSSLLARSFTLIFFSPSLPWL